MEIKSRNKMTPEKRYLLDRLYEIQTNRDREVAHIEADEALLIYINDVDITAAYNDIDKWYA